MLLTDSSGRSLGFLDGERVRDANGKAVLARASSDSEESRLAALAASYMGGRKVLLDLGPADVAVAATQASVSVAADDSGCVADAVSMVRFVPKDRGVLFAENAKDAISLVIPNTLSDGSAPEVNPSYSPIPFVTTGYGLAAKLPRLVTANADFDLKAQTLRYLIEQLRLAREYRVATVITTGANWATGNQVAVSSGNKWNGGASANPLADMFSALTTSLLPADIIVMPELAAQYFYQNAVSTAMRDYVQSGGEMPKVLFARAKFFLGGAPKYLWAPTFPTNIALIRAPSDSSRIPTNTTLRWLGDEASDQGARVDGMFVRTFKDEAGGPLGSDWIVVTHSDVELQMQTTVNGTTTKCQVGSLIVGALQ